MCTHRCRVRLFNAGDKLSNDERPRRLQGQCRRMSQLSSYIFWMDLGEAGYTKFKKRIKQKQVAKQMTDDQPELFAGISPEKAQKMISKAVEVQEKANLAARRARVMASARQMQQQRSYSAKKGNRGRSSQTKKTQRQPRKDRPYNAHYRRSDHRESSSKYSPRKRGANNHRP